jgi:WD40 repeat protein
MPRISVLILVLVLIFCTNVAAQDAPEPIAIDNVSHLETLGYFDPISEGNHQRLEWLPGSEDIFVVYGAYYGSQGVRLYEANNLDATPRFLEGSRIFFSPDGQLYAVRSVNDNDEAITQLFDTATGELVQTFSHGNIPFSEDYNVLTFSADRRLIASAWDQNIRVWEIATGEQRLNVNAGYGWVTSVDFNADGSLIVAATDPGEVSVWDVATSDLIARRHDHFNVTRASFSPVDNFVLTASVDRAVTMWDAENSDDYQFIDAHTDVVYAFFTPDGSRLIVADAAYFEYSRNSLTIWDVETRSVVAEHVLEDMSHFDRITGSTHLRPSGNTLAFWTRNPTILLIDPISGEQLHSLEGGTAWVTGTAFNPDESLLASWDEANELHFWNVATGENLVTFGIDLIVDLIFSHDGTRLITAHTDGAIHLWGIPK